jgi:cytochrome c biogenesis protein CcdA
VSPSEGIRSRRLAVLLWALTMLVWLGLPPNGGLARADVANAVRSGQAQDNGVRDTSAAAPPAPGNEEVVLWYFWREHCPRCSEAQVWLEELRQEYPELVVHDVDVAREAGGARFVEMMRVRGQRASAVPTFILDDAVWVGFTRSLGDEIEAEVHARLHDVSDPEPRARVIDFGPFGRIDVGTQSMVVATLLIAFVDGFNPCSIWVLTVLIAMILGTRSRARIAAIGLTFLIVTATIYGLFIAGLFAAVVVIGHLGRIQVIVALLALFFGAVNVKDFFAFKRGLSFTIPDRFKPKIYRRGRALREDRPLVVTLALTVAMAAGVALVELPCTAGFPVVWTTLLSEAGVSSIGFVALLAIYLLIYLGVEIAILVAAIVTLRATRLQETHGRVLKLFAGMVMIALALVLLLDPSLMEQLFGSTLVVGAAIVASVIIMLADKWWRARKARDDSP